MSEKVYGGITKEYSECWVGIDQSYSGFGLTVLTDRLEHVTFVKKFSGSGVRRMEAIYTWLTEQLGNYKNIRRVVMEAPVRSSFSAILNGEMSAIVQMSVFDVLELEAHQIAPNSLKKYVTGKGNQYDKNLILLKVFMKWGIEFDDDNAADSYAIARIAAQLADTEYERQVLAKLYSL